MKYESELIKEIVDTKGHEKSLLHYESECVEAWIDEAKGAYPKLTDYRGEWLNYMVENPIGEFPYITLSDVTDATVDNVVPYAYKSAILKGQTLVNVNRSNFTTKSNITTDYANSNSLFDVDMKANTTYTIIAYSDNLYNYRLSEMRNEKEVGLGIRTVGTPFVYTTDTAFTGLRGYLKGDILNIPKGTEIKILIVEGDHSNEDIPYFEGMQSVKMPVLTTTGKNICDMVGLANTLNKIDNKIVVIDESTWEMTSTLSYHNVNFKYRPIKFKENTSYTISFEGQTTDDSRTTLANIIKVIYIDGTESNMRSIGFNKVTTPSNKTIDHVRFSYGVSGVKESISNLSIVEGESTSYEPYKSNILTVNEPIELRGIGDVKDEMDCLTGEVIERIGEIVLDGSIKSELWKVSSSEHLRLYVPYNGVKRGNCYSDKFINYQAQAGADSNFESVATTDGGFAFVIAKNKLTTQNANGFDLWLSQNPTTIQYQLQTESIKTVDLLITNQDGNTLSKIKPIEGTMHLATSSDTLKPTFTGEIPVEATTQNLASFIEE